MNVFVDVISDVICPWCFIGKRRLEKAVGARDGQHEVQVRWLPFQLNPTMPNEGISRKEYRTRKFGSSEAGSVRWNSMHKWPLREKRKVFTSPSTGLSVRQNTLDAHRLIWLGDKEGVQRSWKRCFERTSRKAGTSAIARRSSTWLPTLV